MHESQRKHQKKEKATAQEKAKVVDMEPDEDIEDVGVGLKDVDMGTKDVGVEGTNPISKLPPYIPFFNKYRVLSQFGD